MIQVFAVGSHLIVIILPLPIVSEFITSLNRSLQQITSSASLTKRQQLLLSVIILGIIFTESINWCAIERRSLGLFKEGQLRKFFTRAKIKWHLLLMASVQTIIKKYNLNEGNLLFDDTDNRRSKNTTKIFASHKVYDKKTTGYFNGQQMVFMVLQTPVVTIPVDFRFFQPDPKIVQWKKNNAKLKKKKIPKKDRPKCPTPDRVSYPTMPQLALDMIQSFINHYEGFKIKTILADALYANPIFIDQASKIAQGAQVISQLKGNQICASKNSTTHLKTYFNRQPGVDSSLRVRGGKAHKVTMLSARLYIASHKKVRFVIALKYDGEQHYRFLVASDLSWRTQDIARAYTLRWLIEVFIQDWKRYGGWHRLAKQQGVDGSTQGVILSLLCDHFLLLHPEQFVRFKKQTTRDACWLPDRNSKSRSHGSNGKVSE